MIAFRHSFGSGAGLRGISLGNVSCFMAGLALLSCPTAVSAYATHSAKPPFKRSDAALGLMSDIHFDPFTMTATPNLAGVSGLRKWRSTLDQIRLISRNPKIAQAVSDCTGSDTTTSFPIFDKAARFLNAQKPKAVIVSGDLLVHQFECKFKAVFPHASQEDYRDFAVGTTRFVLWTIKHFANDRPVLFAPGNHDSGCGNYRRDVADSYIVKLAPDIGRLATDNRAVRARIVSEFQTLASYRIGGFAGNDKLDAIVVDTTPLSRNATTCDGKHRTDPSTVLKWATKALDDAKNSGRKAWIIGHIPPGVDVRATLGRTERDGKIVRFYSSSDFDDLLGDYAPTIGLAIFGHSHMNEFRTAKGVLIKIVPAVSPSSGNDPAITIAHLSPTGTPSNYEVFFGNAENPDQEWKLWYNFNNLYQEYDFNNSSINKVISATQGIQKYRNKYLVGGKSVNYLMNDYVWDFYYKVNFTFQPVYTREANQ